MRKIRCLEVCLGFAFLLFINCNEKPQEIVKKENEEMITSLPFSEINFENLESLKTVGNNWKVVGQVLSDFSKTHDIQTETGTGILVNQNTETQKANLFTVFEHEDIELDIEFMMPKGSNSGIYFQSRYEIQLFDSWGKDDLTVQDCGSIYERWDDSKPENKKGYEGRPPSQNASKAPGLWQHLYVKFRAPRFDADGNKIANARFEKVVHNGVKIHENVEVTGATRAASAENEPEVVKAPLMFQGDHGPVAFRNMKYRCYGNEFMFITNLAYKYYEVETPVLKLPNLDDLTVVTSDTTSTMDIDKLSKRRDGVAFRFTGNLNVPKQGDYLFHLFSDDGTKIYIDEKLLIDGDGKHASNPPKHGMINLSEGLHKIRVDYFNDDGQKELMLQYEGPEQELRTLQGQRPIQPKEKKTPFLVKAVTSPEMIRSFAYYGDEKRTHAISVGNPEGVHYTYDLNTGSLLKIWKGNFANVTEMWQGRGIEQVLVPQSVSSEITENIIAAQLESNEAIYPEGLPTNIKGNGYSMNQEKRPVFKYQLGNMMLFDYYSPSANGDGLIRTLKSKGADTLYSRVGMGESIEKVNQDYYNIDGKYYLKNEGEVEPFIREVNGTLELMYEVKEGKEVKYSLLW
ncbi:family 16 glycoside hydrolase [Maribacter sp. 2210JD10-5]|uniref:family 16 glycoside hydrolase n=1 Tax=Maribacter sp. 2210JD10-5 TaxID=3386272 RepID=UPI0039BC424D